MKTVFFLFTFLSLVFGLMFTSCVPGKKLKVSEAKVNQLRKDSAYTHSELKDCNNKVKKLTDENAFVQNEIVLAQNDLKTLTNESRATIIDQAMRLTNLQNKIQAQKNVMENLKNSITDALMNFSTDELYVYINNGSVYVSLEEKLLFKSGSDVIDSKGKEALKSLAKVLNTTQDINVLIEGHTDNVPIKTSLIKDNWDLSTARATSIVRILTTDFGFDPKRITASGRSEFRPVKSNETPEGRAGNRRTEIILSPDLNEIFELLYE